MKLIASVAAALLAGCASYGSWLDEVGKPPRPPVAIGDEQALQLTQEAAQLRSQAEAVRARLAAESDRIQRIRFYEQLRDIGDRLSPVERQLRDAGRPLRAAPPRPATA